MSWDRKVLQHLWEFIAPRRSCLVMPCDERKPMGRPRTYATEEERLAAKRAHGRQYQKTHRAQGAAATRRWRQQNPERNRVTASKSKKKTYDANPQKFCEYARQQRQKHKAERAESARLARLSESPAMREKRLAEKRAYWARTHPNQWLARFIEALKDPKKAAQLAKRRIYEARRKARKRGLPDTFTLKQRAFMHAYWHYACAICGNQDGFFWTIADDHWIPLGNSHCPGTIVTNMLPLCHGKGACNSTKHDADPSVWLLRRFGPRKAAVIEKKIAAYFDIVREDFPESMPSQEVAD
jgi:hypothetical protein